MIQARKNDMVINRGSPVVPELRSNEDIPEQNILNIRSG
jgi:hypothetical protein